MKSSSIFMQHALAQALDAREKGEVPVGAVVVHRGQIIAQAGNRVMQDCDPTAHAEILALRQAGHVLKTDKLVDCDLYVTLEPCTMCAQAVAHARIRCLYYGAYDVKGGGVDHGARVFELATCHHRPDVVGGLCEQHMTQVLREFFQKLR